LDPRQVVWTLSGEDTIGEGAVDRSDRSDAVFVNDAFSGAAPEPRCHICPVPKWAPDVARNWPREATGTSLTAGKHRYRLAASTHPLCDIGHRDELVFDRQRLESEPHDLS
jgi:hypothetical protein